MSVPDDPATRPARPCPWMRALVSRLADDTLGGLPRWFAEQHVRGCAPCNHALRALQDLRDRLRRLGDTPPPADGLSDERRLSLESRLDALDAAAPNPTATIVHKHPLAIRWLHWIHFPVLMAMVWSGLLILWAYDYYPLETLRLRVPATILLWPIGGRVVYAGDPDPIGVPQNHWEIVLGYRLADGMAWHFAFAWIFVLNGLAWAAYLALSGQWRHIVPGRGALVGALRVFGRDLRHWRAEGAPEGSKYNDAQRIAYTAVLILGGLMVWTGLAISKPAQLAFLSAPFGGYQNARLVHFLVTGALVAFFFVHVLQVIRAGWNTMRAMLTGWEEKR